jgi:23S rRNA (guanine2445-N2)-methyltransferase / 23S rRNA (guanine2069-N7)-methyltransferase
MSSYRYVATCPKGVEPLLLAELRSFGAVDPRETVAAVTFSGPLEVALRACLWSRTASRILLVLAEFDVAGDSDLYAGVSSIAWEDHIDPATTIAVDAVGTAPGLTHTGFVARRVKDAVVDRLRDKTGTRPSVDLDDPAVRINMRLAKERGTISIDLSGAPLHRRGYRTEGKQAEAPLKENLAAAILMRAGWPELSSAGAALLDPMCGSGTLVIEAALIAADQAPGLLRDTWGFQGWLGSEPDTWDTLLDEADERAEAGRAEMPPLLGRDIDPAAIALAVECASGAGLGKCVSFEQGELTEMVAPASAGLVVTNPPYGERLGEASELAKTYSELGRRLAEEFDGWRAAVLTSEKELALSVGLRSHKNYALYNGAIPVRLYLFAIDADNSWRKRT